MSCDDVCIEMLKSSCVVAALALYFCPPAAATQCVGTHLEQHVLAAPPAQLPPDGGIVVGSVSVAGPFAQGKAGRNSTVWSVRIDGRDATANAAVTTLAPGLVVYQAPKAAKRIAVLEGKLIRARSSFTDSYGAALAGPQASRILHEVNQELVGIKLIVSMSTPAPADAIAMIVYDARSRARTWAPVKAGATTVVVYDDILCKSVPAGTIEPSPGDKITLAWVDSAGRVSPRSAPLTVSQ